MALLEKGRTIMDVKQKLKETMLEVLEREKMPLNVLRAKMSLETGLSNKFIDEILNNMVLAELIFVNDSGEARLANRVLKSKEVVVSKETALAEAGGVLNAAQHDNTPE